MYLRYFKQFFTLCISLSILFSSPPEERSNHFIGQWYLDVEKSLSENKVPTNSTNNFYDQKNKYIVTFSKAGKYVEKVGKQVTEGTWSRYKTDLAVARIETDKKVQQRKKQIQQKLSNPKLTRYEKTRLQQKQYFLNRASVKSYAYEDGYVILDLSMQDKELKLFFSRGI